MAKPLDVLILTDRFEVRGSSTQTLNLAEHMAQRGKSSCVTATNGEGSARNDRSSKTSKSKAVSSGDGEQEIRVRVVCVDSSRLSEHQRASIRCEAIRPLGWPLFGRLARRYLLGAVFDSPPDLIHIQGLQMHSLGRWLARKLQKPYLLTLHRAIAPRDRLRLDPQFGRRILATSEPIRDSVLAGGRVPQELVALVRNGVVAPPASELPSILDYGRRAVIGTAGPLEAGQGLSRFLRAIPRILANGPAPLAGGNLSPEFLIAGAGPDERHLRKMARELGVQSKTTFVSNLFDFSESMTATDIFCLPVERPGMGVTLLQAMARGVAVIATDVGDVSQVIDHRKTGLIIPARDEDAIVSSVCSLLADVGKARAMAAEGRKLVCDRFPLNNMLDDVYRVYVQAAADMA